MAYSHHFEKPLNRDNSAMLSCSVSIIPLLYCFLCYHLWWNKGF